MIEGNGELALYPPPYSRSRSSLAVKVTWVSTSANPASFCEGALDAIFHEPESFQFARLHCVWADACPLVNDLLAERLNPPVLVEVC